MPNLHSVATPSGGTVEGDMKLLCAADLHLGRQASRLPEDLEAPRSRLTPAEAWRRLVSVAVEENVAAVVIAGDVLDDENDFFEAYGDLKSGAQRLSDAGIQLVAVAGNHDTEVLPRLAAAVEGVRVLGAGGVWENHSLDDGSDSVNIVGWSWPDRWVTASPLSGLDAVLGTLDPAVTIGLLHCDLDQPQSRYAPVASADLERGRVDAWLLGHVHKPSFSRAQSGAWSGYLGSVFAADPGEAGDRGAWLLEVRGENVSVTRVPLSPVLYDSVTVDVTAVSASEDVRALITQALDDHRESVLDPEDGGPLAVGLSLTVTGRTGLAGQVRRHLERDDPKGLRPMLDGISYFVHDVRTEVAPERDLAALSRRDDPIGLLARRLQVIEGPPSAERTALLERVRAEMLKVAGGKYYEMLEPRELTDEYVAGTVRRAALRFLDEAIEMVQA